MAPWDTKSYRFDLPRSLPMVPPRCAGFTLVELLVVVAIIVTLIAMLSPALSKAIYQAELASCAGSQKTIASGIVAYTFDQRRAYPYRDAVRHPDSSVWPEWL